MIEISNEFKIKMFNLKGRGIEEITIREIENMTENELLMFRFVSMKEKIKNVLNSDVDKEVITREINNTLSAFLELEF